MLTAWIVAAVAGWLLVAVLLALLLGASVHTADHGPSARCMCWHRGTRHQPDGRCDICDGLPCLGFTPRPARHLHWHRFVARRGVNTYYACRCGSRRVASPRAGVCMPVDGKWLRTGAWTTEEDLRRLAPPRGPAGASRARAR